VNARDGRRTIHHFSRTRTLSPSTGHEYIRCSGQTRTRAGQGTLSNTLRRESGTVRGRAAYTLLSMNESHEPTPSRQTRSSSPLLDGPTPWLWLGLLLLALLFTPLRHLWPLVLLAAGALTLTGRMRSARAVLFSLVALAGGVFSANPWAEFAPRFSRASEVGDAQTIALEGVTTIDAKSFNGFIHVSVAPGEPRLEVKRRGGATVTVDSSDGTLSIEAHKPFLGWGAGADLDIRVPSALNLKINTSNGEITLDGPAHRLEASTSNDPITVQHVGQAELKLETSNGPISVSDAQGPINASTSNASLKLSNANQVRADLETSNGSITVERVNFAPDSSSTITTSNAPITVRAVDAPSGLSIHGDTSNDSLDVNLPGFDVNLERDRFDAKQGGSNVATLELSTSNALISLRP
jgi:Putative adhesin